MNKVIGDLKKSNRCAYPNCKTKDLVKVDMPVGTMDENGQIVFPYAEKGKKIVSTCLLCNYHAKFADKGILQLINQENLVILVAPTEVIALIEKMMDIREELNNNSPQTKPRK